MMKLMGLKDSRVIQRMVFWGIEVDTMSSRIWHDAITIKYNDLRP